MSDRRSSAYSSAGQSNHPSNSPYAPVPAPTTFNPAFAKGQDCKSGGARISSAFVHEDRGALVPRGSGNAGFGGDSGSGGSRSVYVGRRGALGACGGTREDEWLRERETARCGVGLDPPREEEDVVAAPADGGREGMRGRTNGVVM
jgi:hypothetical protein